MRAAFDPTHRVLVLQGDEHEYSAFADAVDVRVPTLVFDDLELDSGSVGIVAIDFRLVDGPLLIAASVDRASIAGSAEALQALTCDIRLFVRHNDLDEPGIHSHIEPNWTPSGERYLAQESASLLLTGYVAAQSR